MTIFVEQKDLWYVQKMKVSTSTLQDLSIYPLKCPAMREPRVNRIRAVKEHEEEEEECERKRLITLQKRVCSLRSKLEKREF